MKIRNSEDSGGTSPPDLWRRTSISEFLISIFIFFFLLGGCAAPGEPVERKPPVPQAIADFAARQSGNDVILTFTLPKETVDRHPLKQTPAIEIYRVIRPVPPATTDTPAIPSALALLVTIPSAMVDRYADHGRIRYADSLKAENFRPLVDSIATYTVRTRASAKKESEDSNFEDLRIYPAPDPIEDVKGEVTPSAVVLAWAPPRKSLTGSAPPIAGYRIYRAEVDASAAGANAATASAAAAENPKLKSPLAKIGESDSAAFRDTQARFTTTYVYSVRSLVKYHGETLESADSNLTIVSVRDTFSPEVPQGLVGVDVPAQGEVPAHIDLSWAISPEPDTAGYNIYRSEQVDVLGTRVNAELLLTPAFRDMNVLPGRRYFYSVTAVDRSGNESPASAPASGGVPAESQPTP